eukprot:m.308933 g.308933  ORF g.308933 m.308933 type:complete len:342 (-) comp22059_c0_seq1:48-1073(-)
MAHKSEVATRRWHDAKHRMRLLSARRAANDYLATNYCEKTSLRAALATLKHHKFGHKRRKSAKRAGAARKTFDLDDWSGDSINDFWSDDDGEMDDREYVPPRRYECATCHKRKGESSFSKSQLRRHFRTPTCHDCVAEKELEELERIIEAHQEKRLHTHRSLRFDRIKRSVRHNRILCAPRSPDIFLHHLNKLSWEFLHKINQYSRGSAKVNPMLFKMFFTTALNVLSNVGIVNFWDAIQFAFHGTDIDAMRAICDGGFVIPGHGNSVRVKNGSAYGQGVYLGANPLTSRNYCGTNSQMLVCAYVNPRLVCEKANNLATNHGNIYVARSASIVCPLYTIRT